MKRELGMGSTASPSRGYAADPASTAPGASDLDGAVADVRCATTSDAARPLDAITQSLALLSAHASSRDAVAAIRALDLAAAEDLVVAADQLVATATALLQVAIHTHATRTSETPCPCDRCAAGLPGCPGNDSLAVSALAPLLRLHTRTVSADLTDACALIDDMPRTLEGALTGELSPRQVRAALHRPVPLDSQQRRELDAQLHETDQSVRSPGDIRRRVDRLAARIAPPAVDEPQHEDRCVRIGPGNSIGMCSWWAHLPAARSLEAERAIDELAGEYVDTNTGLTLEQARADAMLDLLLGQATVTTTVEIMFPLSLDTWSAAGTAEWPVASSALSDLAPSALSGPRRLALAPLASAPPGACLAPSATSSEQSRCRPLSPDGPPAPASTIPIRPNQPPVAVPPTSKIEIRRDEPSAAIPPGGTIKIRPDEPPALIPPGGDDPDSPNFLGWLHPAVAVATRTGWILADELARILAHPDTSIRLARIDATTGRSLARDTSTYRPNAALARSVRERDQHCRFPMCTTAAERCDLDHVRRFPFGPTAEGNLLTLCRRHHGFKHHSRWTVRMTPDGTATWTTPGGRQIVTTPPDLGEIAA